MARHCAPATDVLMVESDEEAISKSTAIITSGSESESDAVLAGETEDSWTE